MVRIHNRQSTLTRQVSRYLVCDQLLPPIFDDWLHEIEAEDSADQAIAVAAARFSSTAISIISRVATLFRLATDDPYVTTAMSLYYASGIKAHHYTALLCAYIRDGDGTQVGAQVARYQHYESLMTLHSF